MAAHDRIITPMRIPPNGKCPFADLLLSLAPAFTRLRRSSKIRVGIAEATVASQHRRSTFFYCAKAAIPDHTVFANRDHRAPGSFCFCRLKPEERVGKNNGGSQNQASHCRPPCSMSY